MLFYVVFAVALLLRRGVGLFLLFASLGLLVTARASGLLSGVPLNFWGDPIVLGFLFGAAIGIAFNKGWRLSTLSAITLAAIGFTIIFLRWIPDGEETALSMRLAEAAPAALILIAFALGPQIDGSLAPLVARAAHRRCVVQSLSGSRIPVAASLLCLAQRTRSHTAALDVCSGRDRGHIDGRIDGLPLFRTAGHALA